MPAEPREVRTLMRRTAAWRRDGGVASFVALALVSLMARPSMAQAQPPRAEVRQIVTFLFQPGKADSAIAIYARELLPAYRADSSMRRFRAYREAESPEPLDLIVVSSFDGMAGMDESNAALRQQQAGGRSVFAWYGALSELSQHHHDQFVRMLPSPARASAREPGDSVPTLMVLEYVRVVPGAQARYERLVEGAMPAVERRTVGLRRAETGRLLLSDGWDYVRFIAIDALGTWDAFQRALQVTGVGTSLDALIAARKTIIVRALPRLAVR